MSFNQVFISGNNNVVMSGGWTSGVRGSGKVVEEERPVTDRFDSVSSTGAVDVEVRAGSTANGLKVQADDNIISLVKTRIEDGVLHVETEGSYNTENAPKVLVELDHALASVSLTGSGDMHISGQDGPQFSATLTGSGNLEVNGRVDTLNLSSMGSGDFNGQGLVADQATLRCMGSGDATVHAERSLNVQLMGTGDCYYAGNPQVSKSIMGTGDLEQL